MPNKKLFGKICCLQRFMCRENNRILSEYGITPVQMHALVYVARRDRAGVSVCQKDIEKELNLRASSVSSLISKLESDGYLKRTVHEDDARTKIILLTEKGHEMCMRDKSFMEKCDETIEAALAEDEREELNRLLVKILESLTK